MKHLRNASRQNTLPLLGSIFVVAVIGTVLLLGSHAASPFASSEVENGTLSGTGASKIADSAVSGGNYVQFGTSAVTPPPSSSGFTVGLGMRSWQDNDSAAANTVHPKLVRFEFNATDTASGTSWFNFYKSLGAQPQPLIGFENPPSTSTMDTINSWARTLAPQGLKYLEFGNENFIRQSGGGAAYAQAAKYMGQKLAGSGVGLLVQVDDNNTGDPYWVNAVAAAVPDLQNYAAGFTMHPYGADGQTRFNRVAGWAAAKGWGSVKWYLTEWGLSFDPGYTLDDDYGYSTSLSSQQAADLLQSNMDFFRNTGKVAEVMIYQSTDQSAHGTDLSREYHFGVTYSDGSSKGAISTKAAQLLSTYAP